jgi:hypothetical protein
MYELLLPMIIAKVQQDKVDKGHILFSHLFWPQWPQHTMLRLHYLLKSLASHVEKLYAQNLCTSSQTHAKNKQRTTTTPRHNVHASHLSFISP